MWRSFFSSISWRTPKLLRSVTPIANGVQALPTQEPVYVKERGLLSDLAKDINQTAEILRSQRADLRKKETARADWISGVSHDIRTPLSMVMGYAGQLEDDPDLSGETRRKASVIRQQSTKIKNLIHDLNLASKLEYNMQPLHPQPVNLIAVARQCAADFLNADLEGKYPLQWRAPEHIPACILQGDPNLLHRALENLLHNAQSHNPDGCRITLEVSVKAGACCIAVSDDGVGMTGKQLEKLQNTPHYMMNDAGIAEPRHGLGLLIVQQIVRAHHGTTRFSSRAPPWILRRNPNPPFPVKNSGLEDAPPSSSMAPAYPALAVPFPLGKTLCFHGLGIVVEWNRQV